MSIKKTWFSYILWLIATGFSVLFTYYVVVNLVRYYGLYGYNQIGFQIGYSIGVIAVAVFLCFLLYRLCPKIQLPKMNKWVGRCLHILIFCGITALFLYTRYYSYITGELHGEQMVCFYEMSTIGFSSEEMEALQSTFPSASLVPSLFESGYIKVLSTVFLFLGNKLELLDLVQYVFQFVTLFSLYFIGWNLQKGILAWIPSFIYTVSPLFASMIGDFGPSNFWLCICLLGMALLLGLHKIWKSRFVSYIVTTLWGGIFCAFVFGSKFSVLFQNNPAFLVGADFRVSEVVMYTELFIWAIVLLLYCVSFWFAKTDSVSFYIMPAAFAAGLLLVLQFYENDVVFFLTIFIGFWLSLLGTESLRLIFTAKPKVLTGQNKEIQVEREDFDWTEMKTIMEQKEESTDKADGAELEVEEDGVPEDTGVIRVSDILNAVNEEEIKTEDKTAMIENVLPMPKKHVSRSFEYSFEPSDDMMHYDVEIENDDYDYE